VNVHHLELFYYVARHGGISEAVRKIPYGIQQPAVSAQIIQLERTLGAKLFQRRPFELTPAGARLYAFIEPFFGELLKVAAEIQGKAARFIRIGASGPVLRHHLPRALRQVREALPGLTLSLSDGYAPQLIQMVKSDEIDLAITALQDPISGLESAALISLPLALLVPKTSRLRSADELWARDLDEPLITLPADDGIARNFQHGLHARGLDWPPGLVVSTLELIETYVAEGFGFGATVVVPGVQLGAGLRHLPLAGFEPLTIGAVWRNGSSPLVPVFVEILEKYAKSLSPVS
jgi:DNA-binding transcriptional LysR family regulator